MIRKDDGGECRIRPRFSAGGVQEAAGVRTESETAPIGVLASKWRPNRFRHKSFVFSRDGL